MNVKKIVISYISSLYDYQKTIALINQTSASGIHVDLMDGKYVAAKNFDINSLPDYFLYNQKSLDIHAMLNNPEVILPDLIKLRPECIYIHPKTTDLILNIYKSLELENIKRGLAINPDEEITCYEHLFPFVDRILLMSVVPGKGGQQFLETTKERLAKLLILKAKYNFEIFIDGGINDLTIKKVKEADGFVSGSYVCQSDDYEHAFNIAQFK